MSLWKSNLGKGIQILLTFVLCMGASTGVRVLASMLEGEHGAPSFATPAI